MLSQEATLCRWYLQWFLVTLQIGSLVAVSTAASWGRTSWTVLHFFWSHYSCHFPNSTCPEPVTRQSPWSQGYRWIKLLQTCKSEIRIILYSTCSCEQESGEGEEHPLWESLLPLGEASKSFQRGFNCEPCVLISIISEAIRGCQLISARWAFFWGQVNTGKLWQAALLGVIQPAAAHYIWIALRKHRWVKPRIVFGLWQVCLISNLVTWAVLMHKWVANMVSI